MLKELDLQTIFQYGDVIAGVDEVGMGPLAGPICACAICLDLKKVDSINVGRVKVDDSKKLSRSNRETLFPRIESACTYGLGWVEPWEIDRYGNIKIAGEWARRRALYDLIANKKVCPDAIISDCFEAGDGKFPCIALPKADSNSFIVACASIMAKVSRDRRMMIHHRTYPEYDWCSNSGYGTPKHLKAILQHGVTEKHRKHFVTPAFLERTRQKYGKVEGGLIP